MRLDKFIGECGLLTRKETAKAAKAGRITVNGEIVLRADIHIDEKKDAVTLDGETVAHTPFYYVFLNKPEGYVSATEDGRFPVVTSLLPEKMQKAGVFPCGRLDKDTTGMMLLTNDGVLSHRLLSPKRHVRKVYRFTCELPLCKNAEKRVEAGIVTRNGSAFKSAILVADEDRLGGEITLTEGKYHEIKRMLEALENRIVTLERIAFADILLDPALARGEWRSCTKDELSLLFALASLDT